MSSEWLTPIYNKLLWRLELIVTEPPIEKLDAEALWSKNTGRGKIIETYQKTERRLQQALIDHCHWTNQKHPNSGKLIKEKRTFTSVIACLHPDVYNYALIQPEQTHLNAMLHNLAVNHEKDFKASLPKNRKPRYLAVPDPRLKKNSVAFLFGPTVYIPDPDEPFFQVVLSLNGTNLMLPETECWRDGKRHRLPVGFYAGQEFLLLVPDQGEGLISIPGWRDPGKETCLLLRRIGVDQWAAFLGGSNQYFNSPKKTSAGIWYFTIPLNDQQTLTVEIAPRLATAATEPNITQTIIPGLADPVSPYTLALEAVGLPALFNTRQQKLQQWTLWLAAEGGLASPTAIHGRQQLAHLSLNQSGLFFTDEAGVSTSLGMRINKPQTIQLSAATLRLLPAPEGLPHFVGLLRLPAPDCYPISENSTAIGRFDPNSTGNSPEISLDQLDQPGSIIGQGFPAGTTLNNIGLSRHHATVRVNGDCLEAKLENPNNIFISVE